MRIDIPSHNAYVDFPDGMDTEEIKSVLTRHFSRPTHDNLETAAVTAADSLQIPPEVKPVSKGTVAEVKALKASGEIGPEKVIYPDGQGNAYVIDKNAVQGIYGGSLAEALRNAKIDLRKGGDSESALLGYPNRDGLKPEETIDAAVTKDGRVVTDLDEMRNEAENKNVAWAAEGRPDEAITKATGIANSITGGGKWRDRKSRKAGR